MRAGTGASGVRAGRAGTKNPAKAGAPSAPAVTAAAKHSAKKHKRQASGSTKFKDAERRHALDADTSRLMTQHHRHPASAPATYALDPADAHRHHPFTYHLAPPDQLRRHKHDVEATALALHKLMK
jgi:hypothetical protein